MSVWTHKEIIRNLVPTLVLALFLTACGGGGGNDSPNTNGGNNNDGNNPSADSPSAYQGSYTGEFTGTETGTWELTIDQDGNATGSATTTTLPVTTVSLQGAIDENGDSTLVSGTAGVDVTFMITITSGVVTGNWTDTDGTGGGTVTGSIVANKNVSGTFSVGVEIINYTFTPLKVIDLTASASILAVNNDQDPVNPAFYDSHGLLIVINQLDNTIAAISYSYFNTGPDSMPTEDYVYLRNCALDPCPSVNLNLAAKTLTFTNTELPVDNSPETVNRPNLTNKATIPATINGSISW